METQNKPANPEKILAEQRGLKAVSQETADDERLRLKKDTIIDFSPQINSMPAKNRQRWITLGKQLEGIGILMGDMADFEDQAQGDNEKMPAQIQRYLDILDAACMLTVANNFQRQRKIAEQEGFLEKFDPHMHLSLFLLSGSILLKIGGASIKDVIDNPNIKPVDFHRSLMTTALSLNTDDNQSIIEENKENPAMNAYPHMTKTLIDRAKLLTVTFILTPSIKAFKELPLRNTKEEEDMLIVSEKILDRYNSNIKRSFLTILNPDSPDFNSLKNLIEEYFQKGEADKVIINNLSLLFLGLRNTDKATQAYRVSTKHGYEENENSSFYTQFAHHIKDFARECLPGILTSEDLPLFVDPEKSIEPNVPSLVDLERISRLICQRTSQRKYDIKTEEVEWNNLIPPTSLSVEFPQGNARKFNVLLDYRNEQGEGTTLNLEFDAAKESFDWKPFLEDTSDPEMVEFKKSILLAAHSILSKVYQQVDTEFQQKQRERQTKTQAPQASNRQSRPKEPYIPRERVVREKRLRPLTPIQEILQDEMLFPIQPEQQRIKNQIVTPDMQELGKKMNRLSSEDSLLVTKGIEEYNQRAVGQFKRLRYSGEEKEPLFTLRVNCGKPGGIRVLMHEAPTLAEANNTRAFEIIDIDYRKNIYRKRGL